MKRLNEIFLESDLSLAAMLMGICLVLWGLVAFIVSPSDFYSFSRDMKLGSPWLWLANYLVVGALFVAVAYHKFPPLPSLLVGTYACLVWTWVASVRGSSNVTSGVTLNILVIVMGMLLVQRSGRK